MSKRLLSVFLVLCMLASVFSGMVALASEPIYTTSAIFFGYKDGDAWTDATALEAGKTLTSKIEVSKTGDAEKMIFALVVYDANKLIKADSATKSVAGETVTFETSVLLPNDIANTHVVAVLWDNVDDMNAIANSSIFPGGSAELEAIYVNGKAIANFDPEVKEYTYDIPTTGPEVAPVITAKPVDGGAKVEVGEAVGFPGTVPVKVTAPGGATETYTVKYSLGGQSGGFIAPKQIGNSVIDKCVWIMEDNIIPQSYAGGGSATSLPLLVEGGLTVGSNGYCDREYKTTEIVDESLVGLDKIVGGIGWYNASTPTATAFKSNDTLPWVNFVLTRGATVMVFFADRETVAAPKFAQYGYEMETAETSYFTNTLNNNSKMVHKYKFYRHYKAGEKVTVPNALQGNNTYTIVLSYDPYGYVAPINHTALTGITVDGVELDGFSEELKTYDYALPASQKDIPEVEVTTLDPNATAVISKPTSFPGKTTITVKCEGYEDSVYTVNYSIKGTGNITMLPEYKGEEIKWGTAVAVMNEDLQNGKFCWSDRTTNANMVFSEVDDSLKGKAYITGALDWNNGSGNYKPLWIGEEYIPNMYTFDLGRTATVKVLTSVDPTKAKAAEFVKAGYTATKADTAYAKAYITSAVNLNYMYTKKIEVTGDPVKVEMPNLGVVPYLVVIDYGTYESLEGLKPEDIPSTELKTLTVNGVEVAGFSGAKTEYNVELTTQNIPEVAASALYKNAVVTVTQATSVPGTATVTVAAEGLDTVTYKINYTVKIPDGYVEGMTISNDNIEMRTNKRAGWNPPLNKDNYDYVYKKTIDVEEGSTKTITLEIANKPYQKGIIILKPTAAGLEDKSAIVNADGSAVTWVDDKNVSRAYDYAKYPEYNIAGVTYGKVTSTKPVTTGSGATYPVYKEMFASDNRYVSGARTHNTRYPITCGTAIGGNVDEWEDCNYIVFENHMDPAQTGSGADNTDTVTFTVDKDVEVIFLTLGKNVSVKEVGVDTEAWAPINVNGINRIYMNWVDSITVAYMIYNGYITAADVVGNYGKIGSGDLGIIVRDRTAFEAFFADWKAKYGAEPINGVQIKESDKAKTGFVNDSATYHHDVFLYAWVDEADVPVVPPVTAGATELTALSVDGKAVAGFKADTYEYTVAIPDAQADFPEVTYTKADEAATVSVTDPTEFPGKATITVSKSGEETKTYTITYKTATEGVLVSDLKLSDKAGINSSSSVWPTTATNLQEGDLLYLGRSYTVTTINDESAKGKDRIMTAVGWGSDVNNNYSIAFRGELINDWISFKTSRGMDVVVYDDNNTDAAKFTNLGYKHATDANNYIYAVLNTGNYAKHTEKYVKHYNAGETVNIPNAALGQAYLVVLDYDNYASLEEDEPVVISTKLSAITVDGKALTGFNFETYEYDVELPAGTLSAVVAATAQDSAASVAITQAAAIPGTATITVTAEGSEPTTYTVNFTKELTDEDIYGKEELKITDNDVEPRTTKRGAFWNGVIGITNFNNMYSKEFTVAEGSTKKISLDITGLAHQQGTLIVKPIADGEDKAAVVNADGTALTWTDDNRNNSVFASFGGTIESYDYENYPEYDEAGATWAKVSSNKPVTVTFNGSPISFPVMEKLIESDGKYVNGSRAQTDRIPANGAIHYTDVDDSWLGSNYIVFDNTNRSAGFTVDFTINQSAEIILISSNGNVTVKETGSDEAWAKQTTEVVREHCSPIDEITIAYMIYHGFLNENQFADVSTYADDTTGTKVTGRRIKNMSAFRALQADLTEKYGSTSVYGVAMVESKREATGFTDAGKDYSYKDYLYNWEAAEVEQPEEPVSTKLSAITVNGSAIEGFDADTLTYNVELPAGTVAATVAATTADTKATAVVTQAAALPGTAVITVSGEGSEDTVYTVNISVAQPEIKDPIANLTMLSTYNGTPIGWNNSSAKLKSNLQVGDLCYSDRNNDAMRWSKVADAFVGKDWIQGGLDWPNGSASYKTAWVQTEVIPAYYSFDLNESAEVTIIANSVAKKDYLEAQGWTYETDSNSYLIGYTNTNVAYNHKFSKYIDASEGTVTVNIPNVGGTSCSVVVDFDAVPVINTTLSDIKVNGVTIEGFSPAINTYTVQVPAGSDVPEVTCTFADKKASAVTVRATEIPGTTTITVSGAEGQEDNVYTINFVEYVVKNISDSDLEARGSKTHTEGAVSVLYNAQNAAKYTFSKEYDVPEGETKTITLSATGLTNQFSSIILVPTGEDADKNVVVKADGSDITWKEYKTGVAGCNGVSVSAYDYQNGGDEEFDADYATYTQFSTDGVSVNYNGTAKTAWVVDKMHYSDDAFVNGAPAVTDRNLSQSGVCWVDFPADWEDCQYITFPSDGTISAGAEITFTVNAPVKVVVLTASESAQVKDSEDTENWAKEDVSTIRRYMHGVDNLSVAYMIHKGYMKESDITRASIAFAGYAAADKVGYYLRRYDALIKMEEDFGGNYGVGIKADRLEATGFVNKGEDAVDYYIRDYSYQDFLDAWVDDEPLE